VIIGAGGFGREVLDVVEAVGGAAYEFLGFLDDGTPDKRLLVARSARHLGLCPPWSTSKPTTWLQ
jgi:hypothetical protein